MAGYPRPTYPNDIIAGVFFNDPDGFLLQDDSGSFQDEPQTFTWQVAERTVYELMFGPFFYQPGQPAVPMEVRFRLTDGVSYDVSLSNLFIGSSNSATFVPMWSRLFFFSGVPGTALTASFGVQMNIATPTSTSVLLTYGQDTDPTLFGVRAIAQIDPFAGDEVTYSPAGVVTA